MHDAILFTLLMKGLRFSETLVLTKATRRNIPEDGILRFVLMFTSFHKYRAIR
jgi:hypothetical protein